MRTRTGYFFMMITKIRYDGKAASLSEQLALLKQHGVLIPDEKTAGHYLSFVGYYRFFAYVKPFLSNSLPSSIAFDRIWNLYTFDQKLRLLVIDAIEKIEVAFRVSISEVMSLQYDPFWYVDEEHFHFLKWHREFMEKVMQLTAKKEHALIKHFYQSYSAPIYFAATHKEPSIFELFLKHDNGQLFKKFSQNNTPSFWVGMKRRLTSHGEEKISTMSGVLDFLKKKEQQGERDTNTHKAVAQLKQQIVSPSIRFK
jgi:hypothetical protein